MVEVLVPQPCHFRHVIGFRLGNFVDIRRAVYQPGNSCGIAQVGGQLAVGVIEKVPLAGQAPYL